MTAFDSQHNYPLRQRKTREEGGVGGREGSVERSRR